MRAALYLSRRGHSVTLYEKSDKLGGQLLHADYSSFKWPLRDYKDYLIAQLSKSAVDVKLNTAATPALIAEEEFDAIIAALGATPKFPPIPGLLDETGAPVSGVYNPIEVYGREQELGKDIVVIGGGEIRHGNRHVSGRERPQCHHSLPAAEVCRRGRPCPITTPCLPTLGRKCPI